MQKMRRIVSVLLAVVMLAGLLGTAMFTSAAAKPYKDVTTEDWFYENVKSLKKMKLMIGYHDGTFRPENNISLAESIAVAARIHAGYTQAPALKQGDVWYEVYTDYAVKNKLVVGLPSDVLAPATRLEFAHLLAKSLPTEGLEAINRVPDGAIPDVKGDEAIYLLYRAGVLIGADDEGNFLPERPITRSEAAAIITRMADSSLRMRSGIFASAEVEVDNSGAVKNETAINADGASATVAAGTATEAGATELALSVTYVKDSKANVKLTYPEKMNAYDIHVEGVAADNTVPVLVELETVLKKGLSRGNISIYHVENGETVAMIQVDSLAELDAHNEFYYDPATGKLTVAMATFSEIAVVDVLGNPWDGKVATGFESGSGTKDDPFIIATAGQLAYFGKVVGGMDGFTRNSFAGQYVKLTEDINLGDKDNANESLIFHPIGYYYTDDKNGDGTKGDYYSTIYSFEGTFDGDGNVIRDFYQNTWEIKGDYSGNYYKDGMGLFGRVEDATIKNLAVAGFSSDGEFTPTGVIAAYASNSTFENIIVTDCNPRVYNTGNGGIVGIGGYDDDVAKDKLTFTNIIVDASNKISALWGSWDVGCGGVIGMYRGPSTVEFNDCKIAAEIDVYNDVCGNYQYYQFRYSGMLIGTVGTDGDPSAEDEKITCNNCVVYYGDWQEHYYCELVANSLASYTHDHQFSRLEKIESLAQIQKDGVWTKAGNFVLIEEDGTKTCYHIVNKGGSLTQHSHEDYNGDGVADYETVNGESVLVEDKQRVEITFEQLGTGYGWGAHVWEDTTVEKCAYTITYMYDVDTVIGIKFVTEDESTSSVLVANADYAKKALELSGNTAFASWVNAGSSKVDFIPANNEKDIILYPSYVEVYTARFVDQFGNVVHTTTFTSENRTITDKPTVPPIEGFEGDWEDYQDKLNSADGDITIKPVYSLENAQIKLLPVDKNNDGITEEYYVIGVDKEGKDDVAVPAYLNGIPITQISDGAFAGFSDIRDIDLPNTLNYLGADAFADDEKNWLGRYKYETVQIFFDGTKAEWDALVAKSNANWDRYVGDTSVVVCKKENPIGYYRLNCDYHWRKGEKQNAEWVWVSGAYERPSYNETK